MLQTDSIVDASEEAQLEAAIKASLDQHKPQQPPDPPSSTATSPYINVNSESECETDDLETFTGSEDESNQGASRNARSGSQEPSSSSHRRNFSAVSGRTASPLSRPSGRGHHHGASHSDAGASGVPSPRHLFSGTLDEGSSLPSTSGLQRHSRLRVLEDSENDSSQGFRDSYANTPNSVEMLGGRASEVQTIDSSSSSSFGVVNVEEDREEVEPGCSSGAQTSTQEAALGDSTPWEKYFGSPDGK